MAKRTASGAAREAARRAAAAERLGPVVDAVPDVRPAPVDVVRAALVRSHEEAGRAEVLRARAVQDRDRAVRQARTSGWTWEQIAEAVGVSRQALAKRYSE